MNFSPLCRSVLSDWHDMKISHAGNLSGTICATASSAIPSSSRDDGRSCSSTSTSGSARLRSTIVRSLDTNSFFVTRKNPHCPRVMARLTMCSAANPATVEFAVTSMMLYRRCIATRTAWCASLTIDVRRLIMSSTRSALAFMTSSRNRFSRRATSRSSDFCLSNSAMGSPSGLSSRSSRRPSLIDVCTVFIVLNSSSPPRNATAPRKNIARYASVAIGSKVARTMSVGRRHLGTRRRPSIAHVAISNVVLSFSIIRTTNVPGASALTSAQYTFESIRSRAQLSCHSVSVAAETDCEKKL
eukprot:Opistho-2@34112